MRVRAPWRDSPDTTIGPPGSSSTRAGPALRVATRTGTASDPTGQVGEKASHPVGPDDRSPGRVTVRAAIGDQDDVGVEQVGHTTLVAGDQGHHELADQCRGGRGYPGTRRGSLGSPAPGAVPAVADLAPGPHRDLPAGRLALADRRGDDREGLAEDVGEEQHGSLHRRQGVEQHQETQGERLGQLGVLLGGPLRADGIR